MNVNRADIKPLFRCVFAFLGIVAFSLLFQSNVSAAVRCETQYGGTQVCVTTGQLQVDKEVYDPQNNRYVDNLGINDYKFSPGELISFRISVKNVGDATLGNVSVADTPQAGFFDLATGALNFNMTNLAPGETRQQELKLRVVEANSLPQSNMICVINAAEVNADNSHDRDTAQICLERQVKQVLGEGVVEVPKTGLPAITWVVSGLFLLVGLKLRKFSFAVNTDKIMEDNASDISRARNLKRKGGENI